MSAPTHPAPRVTRSAGHHPYPAFLRHFPVAVVNSDTGPSGNEVVDGLTSGLNRDKFDVRVLTPDAATGQLDRGQLYGVVQIPSNFSANLQGLGTAAIAPGPAVRPVVTISTNPRADSTSTAAPMRALRMPSR